MITEASYLSGKVLVRTLPLINGRPGPDAPVLKRLQLPQGQLAHLYDGEEGIRYLAWLELLPEAVRGNHYHKKKNEFVYILEGELFVTTEDLETRERASFTLKPGDLAFISSGTAHAMQTVKAGSAIEFSSARFDAADNYKSLLI